MKSVTKFNNKIVPSNLKLLNRVDSSTNQVETTTTLKPENQTVTQKPNEKESMKEMETPDGNVIESPSGDNSKYGDMINLPLNKIDCCEIRGMFSLADKSSTRLSESIKEVEVIHPILVRQQGERYIVVCGHRRVEASRRSRQKMIPARVLTENVSIQDQYKIQLIENVNREDFKPVELARAILGYCKELRPDLNRAALVNLFNNYGRQAIPSKPDEATVTSVRRITGRSPSTIKNLLNLLNLPPDVIESIENKKISPSNGYILASHIDHDQFNNIVREIIKTKPSKDDVREMFNVPYQTENNYENINYSFFLKKLKDLKECAKDNLNQISNEASKAILKKLNDIDSLMKQRGKDSSNVS